MLAAGVWVGNFCSGHFVRAQIEAVNHDNLIDFSPSQPANFNQVVIDCVLFGKNQGSVMCRASCKRIRGWRHVHLAVTDQNVAVAAETAKVKYADWIARLDEQESISATPLGVCGIN